MLENCIALGGTQLKMGIYLNIEKRSIHDYIWIVNSIYNIN